MPKYYGCPCEGCGKPLTLQDDIVVCPDCGAPYHRVCYEKLGRCIHSPAHASGYEWKFPYQDADLRTCPACGERTLRGESVCRCCGKALPPEGAEQPNDRKAAETEQRGSFDYNELYRDEMERRYNEQIVDPVHRNVRAAFGKDELIDGIPYQDWVDYIGSAAPVYLNDYSQMQLRHTRLSLSFSALLFGPFYFFYRKAWKPAFGFLAAELVLFVPSLIQLMQLSGSAYAPGLSSGALLVLARIMSLLSFVLMLVRGLFAKWFYRKSAAAQIRRIRKEFPDAAQRRAVLRAQGGVSWAAVMGSMVLLMVVGACCSMLLGPDLSSLVNALM